MEVRAYASRHSSFSSGRCGIIPRHSKCVRRPKRNRPRDSGQFVRTEPSAKPAALDRTRLSTHSRAGAGGSRPRSRAGARRSGLSGDRGARLKVPNEAPCVDVLFTPHTPPLSYGGLHVGNFADYGDHPFNYTPPANCPGPYAKIVMKVHFSVTAGIQYDRTGAVWVGATNIFFGTTSEPGPNTSPHGDRARRHRVRADLCEAVPGQASVYNIVNSQYTGIIYGTAELDFYPAPAISGRFRRRRGLSAPGGPDGGYVFLICKRPNDRHVLVSAKRGGGLSRRLPRTAKERRVLVLVFP